MYKRIIAVAAALGMIYGSILLPAADTGGEPVANVATTKQVVSKLNASYVSTEEKVYGPIRPVEVKSDDRSSESDMGAASRGEEAGTDGIGIGEVEVGTDIDLGSKGRNDDGVPGPDPDAGDYEPVPSGDNGEAGDYIEETGEDSGEDVTFVEAVEDPEGQESEWSYYGNCHITHYCDCELCTGIWYGSATASGAPTTPFYTVATGPDIPFGTEIMINDQVYVVQDRGVDCGCVDIFVGDHQLALDMGEYWADVYVRW